VGAPRKILPAALRVLVNTGLLDASHRPYSDLLTWPATTWLRSIPTVTMPPVIVSRTHEVS
jgi:hypothetical protein